MDSKLHQPALPADAPRCVSESGANIADVADYLRTALPQYWQVEEHVDPEGELSLIVLAADDDQASPTFLLHDRALVPHVATIVDEAWQAEQRFTLWPDAAKAIVAMALGMKAAGGGEPQPRATQVAA